LGPVSVVDVPVEDEHAFDPVLRLQPPGGHDNVVEQAKPHRQIPLGVMPGRAYGGETATQLTLRHAVAQVGERPGGLARDRGALGTDCRVHRVDLAFARGTRPLDTGDVVRVVRAPQVGKVRGARLDARATVGQIRSGQRLADVKQAAGVLGVPGTRVMAFEQRVQHQPDGSRLPHGDLREFRRRSPTGH